MRVSWGATGLFVAVLGRTSAASAEGGPPPAPPYALSTPPVTGAGGWPSHGYAAASRPLTLRYVPNTAPPPGYHLEESPRKWLLVTGAITFGVPYLISLTIGGASRNGADRWLLLPVAGPAGTLTYGRDCDRDRGLDCAGNLLIVVGLAFDLLAQTAGATLFTLGYVFPKKEWVSDLDFGRRTPHAIAWSIVPRFDGAGRIGLTFAGTIF